MRLKFGSSSGLSSTSSKGGMQGIGSDSSYQPAGEAGLSSQDITAQVSGAFSYLSTAIGAGTKVSIVSMLSSYHYHVSWNHGVLAY